MSVDRMLSFTLLGSISFDMCLYMLPIVYMPMGVTLSTGQMKMLHLVSNLLSWSIVHSWRLTLAWKRQWCYCCRRALSDMASMRSILAAIPQGRWGKIGSKFGVRRYSRDSSWTFGRFEEILHCLINTNASEWYFVACLNSVFIHELLSYVWFCTSGSCRRAMYLRMFWA